MKAIRILVVFLAFIANNLAAESLLIGIVGTSEDDRTFRIGNNLLQEISKNMEVPIKLIALPAERATLMLQNNQIHAEVSRIAAYQQQVKSAIRIEEPSVSFYFHAYALSEDININGWDSLASYSIVAIRGHVATNKHFTKQQTYHVDNPLQAFRFIKRKRADLFVTETFTANEILKLSEFAKSGIKRIDPPLGHFHTYTFFSANYPEYAKSYQQALIEIKASGQYQKILNETK